MNPFIDIARKLALKAGRRILELRDSPLVLERKPDHSLVTNADHEADRILREGLGNAFPDHSILTEESGLHGSADAEYLWVVDPLDGTRAYARGVTGYSVMVGLLKDGKPYAGVVYDPLEEHLYEAVRGEGTWHSLNPSLSLRERAPIGRVRVKVSSRSNFHQMPVITSTGFPKALEDGLRRSLPGPWVPAVNSVGVKVGYMVRQLADIYINHHWVHYWDTCAPQIILEEAGGMMTFFDGTSLDYSCAGGSYHHKAATLATNRLRHRQILDILNETSQK